MKFINHFYETEYPIRSLFYLFVANPVLFLKLSLEFLPIELKIWGTVIAKYVNGWLSGLTDNERSWFA